MGPSANRWERSKYESKGFYHACELPFLRTARLSGAMVVRELDCRGRLPTVPGPRYEHLRVRQSEEPNRDFLEFCHCCDPEWETVFNGKQLASDEDPVQMQYLHKR
jgi:hypothetical protein